MNYSQYAKRVLSDKTLIDLLPDKRVHRLKSNSDRKIPYCTYVFYDEKGSFFSEGKEVKTKHYIQIDINSDRDFTNIEEAIRNISKMNGWEKGAIYEDVDEKTNLMFKCMRFSFEY